MKAHYFLLFFLLGLTSRSIAQEKEKFRFDINLGYANSNYGGNGVLLNLEPKWSMDEKINVGFRFSGAAL